MKKIQFIKNFFVMKNKTWKASKTVGENFEEFEKSVWDWRKKWYTIYEMVSKDCR